MLPPLVRIIIGIAILAYCASRLAAAYRVKVCVTFLGQKYYRAQKPKFYWLAIVGHLYLSLAMIMNVVGDLRTVLDPV